MAIRNYLYNKEKKNCQFLFEIIYLHVNSNEFYIK